MTPTDDAHGSRADVSTDSRRLDLPLPNTLTSEELLAMEVMLLEYVREIARIITERVRQTAAETGLDLAKLETDPDMPGPE
jgi:hypothetical protein